VPPPLDDWEEVRASFALSRDFLHFGGNYLASHPIAVREAIERHRRGLDENPVHYLHDNQDWLEAAVLRSAAAYLGGAPSQIALTDSTTMGLALLYGGLHIRPDQELLTTDHDFYSTHEALRLKSVESGASLRRISLYQRLGSVTEDEIVQSVVTAIRPTTRVVALTWVHSSTGLKLPIRRIADGLAPLNAERTEADRVLLCVDGVHGIGVEDETMPELGCDFFVAGTHKWLFGPRGTGLVWGSDSAWNALSPTIPAFGSNGSLASAVTPGGFHSFEHRWALGEAFDFHQQIGKPRVASRIHELNRQVKDGLAALSHVTLYTPRAESLSAGMVCFDVAGLSPGAVVARLRERGIIATTTPYRPTYARVAPGLLNSPTEVDQLLREIRALV
jgi:isopenicillin-N epimerase